MVDGASVVRQFFQIVMPLCRPALAALATLEFTWLYNDFFWAVVLLNQGDQRPITSSIANLGGQFFSDDNLIAAASMIIAVPTLAVYLALQTAVHQRPDPGGQQGVMACPVCEPLMLPVIGHFRPWTDPTITGDRSAAHARAARRRRSPFARRCLVVRVVRPSRRRAGDGDHRRAAVVDGSHHDVTVPGNWTMQDTGDHPHYTNVQMPFPGPPPTLPERVTTGVYRTTFACTARHGRARRSCCTSAVPRACMRVYVNGVFVGYGTDSRLPSEYDISQSGRRRQDQRSRASSSSATAPVATSRIRTSGGWPACTARSTSNRGRLVHIADVRCDRRLRPRHRGRQREGRRPRSRSSQRRSPDGRCATTLRNPEGTCRRQAAVGMRFRTRSRCRTSSPATSSRRSGRCRSCAPWSAESPNLYEVTCELLELQRTARRDVDTSHRSAPRRGRRSATARQRSTDLGLRRQPPRPPSRPRQGGQRRRHPRKTCRRCERTTSRPCARATTPTTACCTTCATSWGCTSSTRPTSRVTRTTPASATTPDIARHSSSAVLAWCSATATIRRSSCGASATRAATGRITTRSPDGSDASIPAGRCTTRAA